MRVKNGVYVGQITLRGGGVFKGGANTLSLLEIGEHSLRQVKVSEFMLNYVDRAVEQGGEAAVGIYRGNVVAVGSGGATANSLEDYDQSMKVVMFVFWLFFLIGAFSIVFAPLSIPLGLWIKFSFFPKERKRIADLVLAVEASTKKLKESTN